MKFKELVMKHKWEVIRPLMINLYYGPERIDYHYVDGDKLVKTEEEMKTYANKMMEGYQYVFVTLQAKKARKGKDKKQWKIFAMYWDKEFDGSAIEYPYWSVDAENGDLNSSDENYRDWYEQKEKLGEITEEDIKQCNSPIRYSLSMSPWSQWLSMDIDEESLKKCGEVNFICHCLWEMTFHGFSERSVKNEKQKLFNRMKTVDKQMKEGTLKTYTM